ncbi:MAG: nucleoside permease [Prevotella sp.]|jgi:NHS family xanthosine MFS transporter|nr:nucleoside permease [Prevotella sp.]
MSIKDRLIIMNFFQFFIWGAWMITFANYWFGTKHWHSEDFGVIFSTMGIASIFMPAVCGIIADRWINTERLYGILHILCGITFMSLPMVDNPITFFWVILLAMIFYMPTLALSNSLAYSVLTKYNLETVRYFPFIRVWGTVGFIAAMWITNLSGNKASENQFYIAGITAVVLGLYAFSLPKCPPQNTLDKEKKSLMEFLGLDAFKLLKEYRMALFFFFSMLLGAALQLTNAYGDTFLDDFRYQYPDSFVVKYSTIILSVSQISETLFILAIPFFLKRFGIKKVMLISMLAWVLRFGLFAYGNPEGGGLWMILLSCIVYGMAFDFFNISGSLFVDKSTNAKIRSSAQGLFMMMSNGFGAIFGSWTSGLLIGKFFTDSDGMKDWHSIWLCFAGYALVVAILFAIFFKDKTERIEAN